MNYDNDLPNGTQDADIEMVDLTEAAQRSALLQKQGICDHGWIIIVSGHRTCKICGKVTP